MCSPLFVRRFLGAILFCGAAAIGGRLSAAEPLEAARLVEAALRCGLAGDVAGRQELLHRALAEFPEYPPARWQNGYVREGDAWRAVAEIQTRGRFDQRLAEYRRRRAALPADASAADHLHLARWCGEEDLLAPRRFHAAEAVRRAGTPALRAEAESFLRDAVVEARRRRTVDEQERLAADWGKWSPELAELTQAFLTAQSPGGAERSLDRVRRLRDPAAIPALEALVSAADDRLASAVVEALAEMPQPEASLSLARHAVFCNAPGVRRRATEALAGRRLEEFAPWLLSGLQSPLRTRFWIEVLPSGNVQYFHDFHRAGANADFVFRCRAQAAPVVDRPVYGLAVRGFHRPPQGGPVQGPGAIAQGALWRASLAEGNVAIANARTEVSNGRIDAVLAAVSGQACPDPAAWWTWWQEHQELHVPKARAQYTAVAYDYQQYCIAREVIIVPSCFPAGTPVWTETGAAGIETVRPGDQVLTQDPATGELAFRLVLGVTERPPTPLVRIVSGDQSLRATRGHPFWIAGEGWWMAKDLAPGDVLHTREGPLAVDRVEEAPAEPAYNLIVEDFSSYFVGPQGVYVHDNTPLAPTRALLPGLADER